MKRPRARRRRPGRCAWCTDIGRREVAKPLPDKAPRRTTRTAPAAVAAPACAPSARGPGRRREDDLPLREVIGPDDHLLFLLPLEDDRLVRELKAVLVDLVIAEGGLHLELQELLANLVGIEVARPLHRF